MGSSPDEFFKIAKNLAEDDSEAHQRCAASRAYYAMYHMCLNLAEEHEFPEPNHRYRTDSHGNEFLYNPRLHEKLVFKFEDYRGDEPPMLRIHAMAPILDQGRHIRTDADYKLDKSFEDSKADQVILSYTRLRDKIRDLPS